MVDATFLYESGKQMVKGEVAFALFLTGNREKCGATVEVISLGERKNLSSTDLIKGISDGMVDAVSRIGTGDLSTVSALALLGYAVNEAVKEKCLERLSK